ncbi:hypothetical protein ADUPG1_007268, partial [Aduncisulcus paluster]
MPLTSRTNDDTDPIYITTRQTITLDGYNYLAMSVIDQVTTLILSSVLSKELPLTSRTNDDTDPIYITTRQTITLDGYNYLAMSVIDQVTTLILSSSIPSFSLDNIDTPIGVVTLNFDNIRIEALDLSNFTTYFLQDVGVEMAMSDVFFQISLDFSYKLTTFPYSTDSGELIITASGASFLGNAHMSEKDYAPFLTVDSTKFSLGNFSIDLHGSSSILNTIIQIATPLIQYSIETAMNTLFASAINNILNSFMVADPCVGIDTTTAIDIRQPVDGDIDNNYISDPSASIYYGTDIPFYVPAHDPLQDDMAIVVTNDNFQRIFHPDTVVSMFYVGFARGLFTDITINPEDVGDVFPFDVNLGTLAEIFDVPQSILDEFDEEDPISLNISMVSQPTWEMMAGAVALNTEFNAS